MRNMSNMMRHAITGLHVLRIASALGLALIGAAPASADTAIFEKSCSMLTTVKDWLFAVVYVLGAIGLVLIAVSAFLGRFKFAHLISLGGGLFIVAMADVLIDFLVSEGADTRGGCTSGGGGGGGILI